MAKVKRKLETKEPTKKPAFNLPEPNDDMAAFGWALDRLRYPAENSKPNDVWPGRSVFEIVDSNKLREAYGFNIEFINPKFLQVMLDSLPSVREAAEKARAAKYKPAAIAELEQTILEAYKTVVVPAMTKQFKKIANLVAQFYAARLAHIDTFGFDEN
jgi:hypothetical protein